MAGAGGLDAALTQLSAALDVGPSDTVNDIEAAYFDGTIIPASDWPTIAGVLVDGSSTDGEQAERFKRLGTSVGSERVETYLDIFCTGASREPRKFIVTRAIDDEALRGRLRAEQSRVRALLRRRRAIATRDRSAALLIVAHEVLRRYVEEKTRRGLLDYNDLIDKTLTLFADFSAAWVHYKLDLGIDHVLVDEAQDTSHKQWNIVRALTAEFTAGAGARNVRRTMFAVGDEKQSIYSFQDAAPKEFDEMLRHFKSAHDKSGLSFIISKFEHSFRSGHAILAAVHEVFKRKEIAASVTSDRDGFPPHNALPHAAPSVVEIWEPLKPDARKEIEGWDAPFDAVSETSPRVKLARRIARTVRHMVDDGRARCGDVLILVHQRGELFEAIIRALKNQRLDVAGADRLMLAEHIAVMDLMALADALLLPQDDLALATVLRSPLFGFSDDDLFAIAYGRGRATLRTSLVNKATAGKIFADAATRLDVLAQTALRETPFAFYAQLLGQGGARRRFLVRLGPEANDTLDEFLNLTLDYERRESPTLQGFLTWLRDARAEVKRDMEMRRDEVRVMTVHGAKGLEAPVVILADTMTPPAGPRPPRLLKLEDGAVIWAGRKDDDTARVGVARTKALGEAEDEYRRLLYVAMTRARDYLIVCGADGLKQRPNGCWYNLICEPLRPFAVEEDECGEQVWRYRKPCGATVAEPLASGTTETGTGERRSPPSWLHEPAPPEARQVRTVTPSSAFEAEIGRTFGRGVGSAAERSKALRRGRMIHRLMQSLPDIPDDSRKDAIARYLKNTAADFTPAEQTAIAQQVLAILNDLIFADMFAPGSRAEVPIVGRVAGSDAESIAVSGQVDRLAVTADSVLIADYKSDWIVPATLADVPGDYVGQLAFYRAVLARIYPKRTIRAALLFTAGPKVIEIPAAIMDAKLAEAGR